MRVVRDAFIHGTNQPSTIGTFVSSGCIRLTNADSAGAGAGNGRRAKAPTRLGGDTIPALSSVTEQPILKRQAERRARSRRLHRTEAPFETGRRSSRQIFYESL